MSEPCVLTQEKNKTTDQPQPNQTVPRLKSPLSFTGISSTLVSLPPPHLLGATWTAFHIVHAHEAHRYGSSKTDSKFLILKSNFKIQVLNCTLSF